MCKRRVEELCTAVQGECKVDVHLGFPHVWVNGLGIAPISLSCPVSSAYFTFS